MPVTGPGKQIDMFFITGFLGSGKTTFLNNLLKNNSGKNLGVIVNEFGEINVDVKLLDSDTDMKVTEINNGSIFCSCLSGSFVESIISYQDLPVDCLFVESTGMARPSSLDNILEDVNKLAPGRFNYHGMVCVVDASSFMVLSQSVNAVREQIQYSDIVLINKIDLVEADLIKVIEEKVKGLNPQAEIIKTSYGRSDLPFFEVKTGSSCTCNCSCSLTCDELTSDRPQCYFLKPDGEVSKDRLVEFLEEVASKTYRIKGFIKTGEGYIRVDCVGDSINFERTEESSPEEGLVIFAPEDVSDKDLIL
ncbi:CobW family GTP-binding protein [Halothermothrix orenii]|uniref:Cobalamin synthesis protein P47K n=1 Tax=Halothermothrix orenii (strain H 168 / OCM 544 / DSM 9562) TaxID=373903 RepID=B8CYB2_HALOH|nr:CobW family GTP-binding protein [Halothermothrix orenii]ACL70281.1 cobalamin synthesis protein P47K [Halothermothrix orenii H 168]